MGVKQSKRSVDITEISTKGEIEGFGNEGKVEKIIDGVVEKVAANGHVEGDLQNGVEALQNGLEPIQNGEAATVATEKVTEKKSVDESSVEGGVVENGQMENGEVHEEAEKTDETKKSQDKKDKKKDKKEKVVKKKFSFRNFSFSKKDKSKPPKEEKSPEKVDEAGIEEMPTSPEKEEDVASPSEGQLVDAPKPEEVTKQESDTTVTTEAAVTVVSEQAKLELDTGIEVNSKPSATLDDLPPPLPASPPPSEPLEAQMVSDLKEIESSESGIIENYSGEMNEIGSSISNFSPMPVDIPTEDLKDPEQIVFEAGKQIEEKATSLLKTVEERAEESMRTTGEMMSQKTGDMEAVVGRVEMMENLDAKEELEKMANEAKNPEEAVPTIPLEISNLGSIPQNAEETSDKVEEDAGESLADMPKDLTEEMTGATMEASGAAAPPSPPNPEAPPAPATPPAVKDVAGE